MKAMLLGVVLSLAFSAVASAQGVAIEPAFPNLRFERPLLLLAPPDGTDRVFVVEQIGKASWFENRPDVTQDDVHLALDLRSGVLAPGQKRGGNEEGFLGMAFCPHLKDHRHVFTYYSAAKPRRSVVSRWTMDEKLERVLPDSEHVIMEIPQPYSNHNGGHIEFGPDGFLYITLGDGGAANDPHNNSQDKSTLLGSILRIDVHFDGDEPYRVPPDNPFVNEAGSRPEIWAYGLRNAWRFAFDPETGDMWAGDVGQNKFEEIDIIVKGGNYGWNIREGFAPFRDVKPGEEPGELRNPVIAYDRKAGISVTGGRVYRGKQVPSLVGAYTYADFGSGRVWMLRWDGSRVTENRQVGRVPAPSSFGVDAAGELYICSFGDGREDEGRIYKFVAD